MEIFRPVACSNTLDWVFPSRILKKSATGPLLSLSIWERSFVVLSSSASRRMPTVRLSILRSLTSERNSMLPMRSSKLVGSQRLGSTRAVMKSVELLTMYPRHFAQSSPKRAISPVPE